MPDSREDGKVILLFIGLSHPGLIRMYKGNEKDARPETLTDSSWLSNIDNW
jgi:hypothetical protein